MTVEERLAVLEDRQRKLTKWCVEMHRRLNRLDPLPEVPEPKRGLPRHYSGPVLGPIDLSPSDLPTQESQREISEQKP